MIVTEKYTYSHGGYGYVGKQPERQVRVKRLGRGILPSCVALTIAPIPTPVTGQASYLYDGNGNLARGIVNGVGTFYPGRHNNREVDGANVTVKKFYTRQIISTFGHDVRYAERVSQAWNSIKALGGE